MIDTEQFTLEQLATLDSLCQTGIDWMQRFGVDTEAYFFRTHLVYQGKLKSDNPISMTTARAIVACQIANGLPQDKQQEFLKFLDNPNTEARHGMRQVAILTIAIAIIIPLLIIGVMQVFSTAPPLLLTEDQVVNRIITIWGQAEVYSKDGLIRVLVDMKTTPAGNLDRQETTRLMYWTACAVHQNLPQSGILIRAYAKHEGQRQLAMEAEGTPTSMYGIDCTEGGTFRPIDVFTIYRIEGWAM